MMRWMLAALLGMLAACETVPANPTVWTTGDLARAIETNLARVGNEVGGDWAQAGTGCAAPLLAMSLGPDRPPFMPDVAALAALVPGAELAYERRVADEQVYRLGAPGSGPGAAMATIVRDLRTDGIIWRRPDGDEMRLFPTYLSFESGRLSLFLDDDALRIQVGGASLLEFERCG
ncbi:MAG: hypothetical protein ACFCVH_07535 [Alphaproteobacteria bacterium]